MKKLVVGATIAGIMLAASSAAHADLIGASVNGTMWIDGDHTTNYFDPNNGYVPGGYGNSVSPNGVVIGVGVEFGYQDGSNTDSADFTGTALTITDVSPFGGSFDITYTFVSASFVGLALNLDSQNFAAGLSYSLNGDTLTVHTNQFTTTPGATQSALFTLAPATAPEPTTLALLGLGLAGLAASRRRKQ